MTEISRATIALRVGVPFWREPVRRRELLAALADYRDVVDEVALFTSTTHPPLPLAKLRDYAATFAAVLPDFKALGIRAGINHLSTLGHHNENLPNSLNEPWQKMMNLHGVIEEANYCPNDPDFRQYVWDSYVALAASGPDFLWVDDDVRLQGHGKVTQACFCDRCLAQFSEETGTAWTRATLTAAVDGGAERLAVRRRWLAHNRRVMHALLAHIRAAVNAVNPAITVGLMTAENYYSGTDYAVWAEALAGQAPAMWRPGGGYYTDDNLPDFINKSHSIGRQVAPLPATVTDIQSEIENFPYQRLKKAAVTLALETAAYIGAGCTGTALNIIGTWTDPMAEQLPYFDAVRAARPLLDRAAAVFGRSQAEGIWQIVHQDEYATTRMDGEWSSGWGWHGLGAGNELAQIGLPLAYDRAGAKISLLAGDSLLAFSPDALREILAGGVLLDGSALRRLHALGLGELTGFAIDALREDDTVEQLTDDPLNGAFAGAQRDCRQSFKHWAEPAFLLRPTAPGARVIATAVDYGNVPAGHLMGVCENALGGRVAVCGYFPWKMLHTLAKTAQLKKLARWLSREALPAYIASYHKIALWARRDAAGQPALLLINATLDPAADVRLLVQHAGLLALTRADGRVEPLPAHGADGPYAVVRLDLAPWEAVLVSSAR